MTLAGEVQEKVLQATVRSAQLKRVLEELRSVMSKLATRRVESADSRWSAYSVFKCTSKAVHDVSIAFMGGVRGGYWCYLTEALYH